jgi:hypothetical protein
MVTKGNGTKTRTTSQISAESHLLFRTQLQIICIGAKGK